MAASLAISDTEYPSVDEEQGQQAAEDAAEEPMDDSETLWAQQRPRRVRHRKKTYDSERPDDGYER